MKDSVQKFFQKKDQLTISQPEYAKAVSELFLWLVKNDQVAKDLTTESLFSEKKNAEARIITRQDVTVAGLEEIGYLLTNFTTLKTKSDHTDGKQLQKGETVMELTGEIQDILSYERVILNILQRFCGIATETTTLISSLPGHTHIAATRKTHWSILDKKAVAVGGGLTHRLNLADGILVKDNHLLLMSEEEVLEKLLQTFENTLIEIEVEDEKTLFALVAIFSKKQTTNVLGLLLDNFSPTLARELMTKLPKYNNILYEASGGITSKNLAEWAQTGVDIISLGALTHSPKAANLSLELKV